MQSLGFPSGARQGFLRLQAADRSSITSMCVRGLSLSWASRGGWRDTAVCHPSSQGTDE